MVGDDQHPRRLAAAADADRLAGERPAPRGGAFQGGEDEVAGVEEARASCAGGGGAVGQRRRRPPRRARSSAAGPLPAGAIAGSLRQGRAAGRRRRLASAPRPSASRPAPEPRRLSPEVRPCEAPSSWPTPFSRRPPPAEIRLRPPLTWFADPAQALDFVADRGEHPRQVSRLPRLRQQRRVFPRGAGEFGRQPARPLQPVAPRGRAAASACRAQSERLPTAVLRWASASSFEPSARRSMPALAPSPPAAALSRPFGQQARSLACPRRAGAEQCAAGGAAGEAAAQLRHRPAPPGAGRGRGGTGLRPRPGLPRSASFPSSRSGFVPWATAAGPITALIPGWACDPPLPAAQQRAGAPGS